MPQIKSSFVFNSQYPNFTRDSFETLQDMLYADPNNIDMGHISYCKETKKHYIFGGPDAYNTETGCFIELSFQDMLIYETKEEMKNLSDASYSRIPLGKLAFCKESGLVYYNTYGYPGASGQYDTGFFKELIDMNDASYVTIEQLEEFRDIIEAVQASGMLTYATKEEMASVTLDDNIGEGQIAFCIETGLHYYFDPSLEIPSEEYGYFKLISGTKVLTPIITPPSAVIYLDGDASTEILLSEGSPIPDKNRFTFTYDLGLVDYSEFPESRPNETYVQSAVLADSIDTPVSVVMCDENPTETVQLGDQNYYFSVYFVPKTDPPVDSNGKELVELQWDRNTPIKSDNKIVVNGTRNWFASSLSSEPLTEQPLVKWEDVMTAYVTLQPSCIQQQMFKIPRELQHIYLYISGHYVEYDMHFDMTYIDNYYIYTYDHDKHGHRGALQIKLEF